MLNEFFKNLELQSSCKIDSKEVSRISTEKRVALEESSLEEEKIEIKEEEFKNDKDFCNFDYDISPIELTEMSRPAISPDMK